MVILKPPMFPGLEKDVAIIAVAEKGFLNLELRYAMHAIILLVIINLNSTLLYSLPFILSLPFLSLSSSLLFILSKSVNGTGGHASMPPPHTSIGILSNAITKLENNPHPPSLLGSGPMLDFLGRELAFPMKAVMANVWMFKWLLYSFFSKKPTLNALIRYDN